MRSVSSRSPSWRTCGRGPARTPSITSERTVLAEGLASAAVALDIELRAELAQASGLALELLTVAGRRINMTYDAAAGELCCTGAVEAPMSVSVAFEEISAWRLVVDRSLVELYAVDGRATLSFFVKPDNDVIDRVELVAKPGAARDLRVWHLRPTISQD